PTSTTSAPCYTTRSPAIRRAAPTPRRCRPPTPTSPTGSTHCCGSVWTATPGNVQMGFDPSSPLWPTRGAASPTVDDVEPAIDHAPRPGRGHTDPQGHGTARP